MVEVVKPGNLGGSGVILCYITPEEFDAFLAGDLDRDDLHRRVDRRRAGREPVEPPGGSRQVSITRWCD